MKAIRTQGGVKTVMLPTMRRAGYLLTNEIKTKPDFPKPRIRKMKCGRRWVCHHGETYGFGSTPGDAYREWGERRYERIKKVTGFPNLDVEGRVQIEVHPPFC